MLANYADRQVLEIRGSLGGAALFIFYMLWFLFVVAAVVVAIGVLAWVAAYGQADTVAEPAREIALLATPAGLAAALLAPVIMNLLQKTRRLMVTPLLPGFQREFILCDEGLYARQIKPLFARNKCYRLHPWSSLSLFVVKERKGRVGLREGKRLLILKSDRSEAAGPYMFGNMLAIIMAHLPEGNRTVPAKKEGYHWGALLVGLVILFVADFAGSMYFQHVGAGPVGDNRCDVCGRSLVGFTAGTPVRIYDPRQNMKLVHEYCDLHALVDAVIYPYPTIAALRTSGLVDSMVPVSVTVLVWFWLISAVVILALPTWVKLQYRYAQ